ncbi:MAG: lysophospholipase [Clostridiales bacterium]|nr:lysophospholipase [Clostridiales bacterium]
MIKVLFQGDSITDGNRYKDPETRWDLNHQIGHSYVFTVVGRLAYQNPGKYLFVNRGVSGDSVETIAKRWKVDTLDEKPDVLSLLIGINGNGKRDGKYEEGIEEHLNNFEKGYRELLSSACQVNPNLKLIIMEPFALPVGKQKENYENFMLVFRRKQQIIRQIAECFNAKFIPLQKPLEELVEKSKNALLKSNKNIDPNEYWLWDGIHPTEQMHAFIADLWLEAFAEIIAK